ncbi:nucleoside hydrolase, partial [Rhizobiaceae sp. 2RAB30]
ILALGPLTNIARLLRDHPASAGRIGRIVVMGGAVREPGNIGPRSEFNLAADPEAADIVLRAGLDLVLVPLDVTRKVRAGRADTAALRAADTPAAIACADLVDAYFQSSEGRESRPLHDPCVMLLCIAPTLFGHETLKLSVYTGDGPDAGALIPDESAGADLNVAMSVDGAAVLRLLVERLAAGSV